MKEDAKVRVEQKQEVKAAQVSNKLELLDSQSLKLVEFLKPAFRQEESFKFNTVTDFIEALAGSRQMIESFITNLVDQVEDKIVDLKTSILSLNELLPLDPLQKSGVYVFNTTKQNFLKHLEEADLDALCNTPLGKAIRERHIHADLESTKAVHGVFVFFPLGHQDNAVATHHATALGHFCELAHRNCFQIYFNVDNPGIMGKERYSELPEDINQWIREYYNSIFFKKLQKDIDPNYKRRLTHVFNPYLVDTERLQERFPLGHPPKKADREIIDTCCWAPPVSLMAKRLIYNYERLGWCGQLFGIQSGLEVSSYRNDNPKEEHSGRSFSSSFHDKFSLTLWNYLCDREFEKLRDQCLITPIQRQSVPDPRDKKRIIEKVAFLEAQTMLPSPPGFREVLPEEYNALSGVEKEQYDDECQQRMFNALGTALIEDTICRGLILITRQFIGQTENQAKDRLKQWVDVYMSVFGGKKGMDIEAYNFEPALLDYKAECAVVGQRAFVKVRILPNQHIRNIQLAVYLKPSHIFYKKDGGGRDQ